MNSSAIGNGCESGCAFSRRPLLDVSACRIIDDLSLLVDVCQILERSLDLGEVIKPVLAHMSKAAGMLRGALSILSRDGKNILIDESFGYDRDECETGRSKIAEKLIRKVIETDSPVVVPDITQSEHFKHRIPTLASYAVEENGLVTSFISVPIKSAQNVIGTLSVERQVQRREGFEHDLRLLTLISSVLAQAVVLRCSAQERMQDLRQENERLQEQIKNLFKPQNMIGSSSGMRSVYFHIEQVASSNTTVFIRGESGVGKELVANAIHQNSARKKGSFVKVNCAALPDSIIESELFGHEKGAFTGAISMRKGRFELADGGTIFLDEIGDLSVSTQIKLLRVLQEREFERVGSQTPIRCDLRVIAATSRNVEELIEQQKFRVDLYYRLNVFPIYVPPLRERKADILQLADHFVEKYNLTTGKTIRRVSTSAIDLLMSYHWPGNVRELENCIERAVVLCHDDAIQAHHLPATLQADIGEGKSRGTLDAAVNAIEMEMIVDALKAANGNGAQAARALGITERIMGLRLKKHRIDPERYRTVIEPSAQVLQKQH